MRAGLVIGILSSLLAGCGGGGGSAPAPAPTPAPMPAPGPAPAANETERLKQVIAESQYHADLGAVHLNHRRVDAAIAAYRKAVQVGEGINENALHIWALGKAYKAAGDEANWKANLERAAGLFARFAADKERQNLKDYYCEQLALLYGELGNPAKAVDWIDQMASEGSADSNTLRSKARLYIANGLGTKALAVLEAAEQRAQPGMEQERASYTVAEVLVGMRNFAQAEARLKSLAASAGEPGLRAQAKRLLFQVYDKTGRLDELDLDRAGGAKKGSPGDGSDG